MDLTIQDWGAIGEMLGGIAVIATLIYLSVQLRQAVGAVRSSVATIGAGYGTQVWQVPIDKPEVADILMRGNRDAESLSDNEFFRYHLFYGAALRGFEQYFILHQLGSMTDAQWAAWQQPLDQILQEPGARKVWELIRGQHNADFTQLVDGLIASSEEASTGGMVFRLKPDS